METQPNSNPSLFVRFAVAMLDFVASTLVSLIVVFPILGFWAWRLFAAESIVQLNDAYKPLQGFEFIFLLFYFVFTTAMLFSLKTTPGMVFFGLKLMTGGKKLTIENLLKWQFINLVYIPKTLWIYLKKFKTEFEGDRRLDISLNQSYEQGFVKVAVTLVLTIIAVCLFASTPKIKYQSIKSYQLSLRGKPHIVPERAAKDYAAMQQIKYILEHTQDAAEIKKQAGYAIEITKHVVEKDEENAQAWNFLGNAYVAKGEKGDDEKSSLDAFAKAAEIESTNARYLGDYGAALSRSGRLEDAVVELKKSLSIREDAQTYFQLGIAYFKLENTNQSSANLKKAKELFLKDNEFKQHDGDIEIIDGLIDSK